MDGGISPSKIRRACLEDRNCGIKTIGFFFSSTISKSEYADSKLFLRRKIISRERGREARCILQSLIEIPNAEQLPGKQIQFQRLTDSGRSIDIVFPGPFR